MRNKAFLLSLVFLFLMACKEDSPKLLIPEEKLVEILADAHLAEAAIQNLVKEVKDSLGEVYYQQIYEIHQINKEDFEQTMAMLREDPIRMEKIYRMVMDKLSTEKVENN